MEVRFPIDVEGRLAHVATARGRDSESLVFEAIERMIGDFTSEEAQFVEGVDKGLAAADRGEFVEHLRVRELIDYWYPA